MCGQPVQIMGRIRLSHVRANLVGVFHSPAVTTLFESVCVSPSAHRIRGALSDLRFRSAGCIESVEGAEVNLRTFYLDQHRYFFSLWAVLLLLAVLVSALTRGGFQLVVDGFRIAGFAAAVLPAWSGHRRVHGIVTVAALAALILYIVLFRLKLGAGIIVSRWA